MGSKERGQIDMTARMVRVVVVRVCRVPLLRVPDRRIIGIPLNRATARLLAWPHS